jgi:demethylmenaquinone methyltransferase/2-methoxy-6-polyprenyl-1,4-benzoquinol methylase
MAPLVDKSGERVRKMFGEISRRYDLMNHLLSGGIDIYWRRVTVKQAPPLGTAPILDVCTGTGDLALAYWKAAHSQKSHSQKSHSQQAHSPAAHSPAAHSPAAHSPAARGQGTHQQAMVTGTDFTPEMLEIARQKAARAIPATEPPIQFLEADTQQLPFPDDQFQIVSVAFGLRNVSDTRAGLLEMQRVCQPGGQVVVLEFSQPTLPGLAAFYRWYFRNVLPRIGQLFARNQEDAYNYLPQSVSEFPSGQQLADLMHNCGLQNVRFQPLTFGIATLYIGRKPDRAPPPAG